LGGNNKRPRQLGWRNSLTDEQWADVQAANDDSWPIYAAINRAELLGGVVELCKRPPLEARIDWFAFKGQHTEDAFMYPAETFLSDKSLKSFNSESKLAECQRALG